MVMVVMIVIVTMMIVKKCLLEKDLTFQRLHFKVFNLLKATSGIVESMKTTVERMTTAIDVNAYS